MLVADDEPDDEPGGEPDAETDGEPDDETDAETDAETDDETDAETDDETDAALVADGAAAAAPLARGFVWSVGLEAARPAEEPWNPP